MAKIVISLDQAEARASFGQIKTHLVNLEQGIELIHCQKTHCMAVDQVELLQRFDQIRNQLTRIEKGITEMSIITDRLTKDVEAQSTQIASMRVFVANLAQQIRDNVDDPPALAAVADNLEANTQTILDVINANTPTAPAAAPAPAINKVA